MNIDELYSKYLVDDGTVLDTQKSINNGARHYSNGKSASDLENVLGSWPGDESDEDIARALKSYG